MVSRKLDNQVSPEGGSSPHLKNLENKFLTKNQEILKNVVESHLMDFTSKK